MGSDEYCVLCWDLLSILSYVILDAFHMSKLNQSWSIILIVLMLLMRIVLSFVWSEFSSVGREEWCNKMKNGQNLKLGYAHVTPRNMQEVQASKLGDARASPSSSTKISGHLSMRYIFIASYNMCYSWSVFVFVFSFLLFLFDVINGWTPSFVFWRRHTPF